MLYTVFFHHNALKYINLTDGCYKLSSLIDSDIKECSRISEKEGITYLDIGRELAP